MKSNIYIYILYIFTILLMTKNSEFILLSQRERIIIFYTKIRGGGVLHFHQRTSKNSQQRY